MRAFPSQYHLQPEDVLYFSHIPKTAGMTFRTIMEDQFHCHEVCPATLDEHIANISPDEMKQYRLFRGHLGFIDIPKLIPGKRLLNVNILREPVARVISHYDYIRRTPADPRYEAVKDITLDEFAEKLTLGKFGKNMQTYRVAKVARFNLNDLSSEETLELAKQSLDQFAFVGILEKFQASLFLLSYIFGWKPIHNSRKENASKLPKTKVELSPQTLDIIREQTQLDQVLYQYAQEIFERRFAEMTETLTQQYSNTKPLASLLEHHAEQRYNEQKIPAADTLTYHFCQPLRGTGWQRREFPNPNTVFRWMGDTISTLDLPLAIAQDLQIEFCILNSLAPDILQSLTLEVGGQNIPLLVLYGYDTTTILQGTLPRSVLRAPFTCLTFRVNRTISAQTINPSDRDNRPVGLAFTSIQTFPLTEKHAGAAAFLFDAPAWKETIAFIQQHLQPGEKILAPTVFREQFPNHIPEFHSMLPGEIRNYGEGDRFEWAIVHKGMKPELSRVLSRLIGYSTVYANDVFVVFRREGSLPSLSITSPHVKSLYIDYLKYVFQSKLQVLQKIKIYGKSFKQE
jgi:Sulfotransferase family